MAWVCIVHHLNHRMDRLPFEMWRLPCVCHLWQRLQSAYEFCVALNISLHLIGHVCEDCCGHENERKSCGQPDERKKSKQTQTLGSYGICGAIRMRAHH